MQSALTIGYDATPALRQTAGIGRYARELLIALARLDSQDSFRVIFDALGASVGLPPLNSRFQLYPIPASDRVMNLLWQRMRLPIPIEIRTGGLDVFHCPDFSLPPSRAASIVTIHDVAFEVVPQLSYPSLATYLHRIVPRAVARARAVIVPSNHTKEAVVRRFGADDDKVHVIPEGVCPQFRTDKGDNDEATIWRLGVRSPFLLSVGTLEPRKNYDRLLLAFAALRKSHDIRLVVVGRRGWLHDSVFKTHADLGFEDSVLFLDKVGDSDLSALYRLAEVTVYASLYEGFGLPALEALASGSPLVCSGNTSLPEVVGDAALLFDPWDVADITRTIDVLLNDVSLRSRLRLAGAARASAFTWSRAAEATSKLYHDVAAI